MHFPFYCTECGASCDNWSDEGRVKPQFCSNCFCKGTMAEYEQGWEHTHAQAANEFAERLKVAGIYQHGKVLVV